MVPRCAPEVATPLTTSTGVAAAPVGHPGAGCGSGSGGPSPPSRCIWSGRCGSPATSEITATTSMVACVRFAVTPSSVPAFSERGSQFAWPLAIGYCRSQAGKLTSSPPFGMTTTVAGRSPQRMSSPGWSV